MTKQLFLLSSVKTSGRLLKFFWPFQKNWTLQIFVYWFSASLADEDKTPAGPTPAKAAAAFAAAGVSMATESVQISETKMQDILQMAAKMDNRKHSKAAMSQSETEIDEEDEDYTPHFQRVYISGDDNTGVSFFVNL